MSTGVVLKLEKPGFVKSVKNVCAILKTVEVQEFFI